MVPGTEQMPQDPEVGECPKLRAGWCVGEKVSQKKIPELGGSTALHFTAWPPQAQLSLLRQAPGRWHLLLSWQGVGSLWPFRSDWDGRAWHPDRQYPFSSHVSQVRIGSSHQEAQPILTPCRGCSVRHSRQTQAWLLSPWADMKVAPTHHAQSPRRVGSRSFPCEAMPSWGWAAAAEPGLLGHLQSVNTKWAFPSPSLGQTGCWGDGRVRGCLCGLDACSGPDVVLVSV